MKIKRASVIGSAVCSAVVLGASAAWACTVFVSSVSAVPNTGPELATVMVQGDGLAPGAGRSVELRWEGSPQQVLAVAPVDGEGRFSAEVKVPSAAAGIHSIVAVADGAGAGRTVFEITTPLSPSGNTGPALATPDQWADEAETAVLAGGSASSSMVGSAGAALLAIGLLGLTAGFAVAGVRRRRTTAS